MKREELKKRREATATRIGYSINDPRATNELLDAFWDTFAYINLLSVRGDIEGVVFLQYLITEWGCFQDSEYNTLEFIIKVNEFARDMCKGPSVMRQVDPLAKEIIH